MNYYIITGASKGIGESLVRRLLETGNTIFAVSRTLNENLTDLASSLNVPLFYFEADLSNPEQANSFINNVFEKIRLSIDDRIALINNAGMLDPIAPVKSINFDLAEKHLLLNMLTPLILSSVFLDRTADMPIAKVILNISSGASFIPYSGWSAYCSSKAGLDMLTKVAGLEQGTEKNPATIFSLSPGIIDTGMQELIRQQDETNFPERNTFNRLFEEGRLSSPADIANVILRTIFSKEITIGSVLTIEQLKEL